jgi:hypothetical protein
VQSTDHFSRRLVVGFLLIFDRLTPFCDREFIPFVDAVFAVQDESECDEDQDAERGESLLELREAEHTQGFGPAEQLRMDRRTLDQIVIAASPAVACR